MKKIIVFLLVCIISIFGLLGCKDGNKSGEKSSKSSQTTSSSASHGEIPSNAVAITTEDGLNAIRNDLTATYYLASDITLTSTFATIGDYENPFNGTFNGNGYTISNMNITSSVLSVDGSSLGYFAGMFACITGTVKNVTFKNFTVTIDASSIASTDYLQIIKNAGSTETPITDLDVHAGIVANNKGFIDSVNASVNISVKPENSIARVRAGAIAGKNSHKIANCVASGSVTSETTDGYGRVGGIAGYANTSNKIYSCTSSVDISAKTTNGGKINSGGIVGNMECGEISYCHSFGQITTNNLQKKKSAIGGLIGLIDNTDAYVLNSTTNAYEKSEKLIKNKTMNVTVRNNYSSGTVSENTSVKKGSAGGLIGEISVFATDDTLIYIADNSTVSKTEGTLNLKGGFLGSYEVFDGVNTTAVTNLSDLGKKFVFSSNRCLYQDALATQTDDISVPERA